MYHNTSSTQESNMNLLTSPYDPNQLDYVLANQLGYTTEPVISHHQHPELQQQQHYSEQQLQQLQQMQQQQQQHNETDIWNVSFMPRQYSPIASDQSLPTTDNDNNNNHTPTAPALGDFYSKSPSPQAPIQAESMNTLMSHDFASRSPESSSSTESNLVSPPQQYHPSNNDYSDLLHDSLSIPPPLVSKHHHHPHQHHARRSSSVPPHFHRFKQHQQQLMQVVDPNFPYHNFHKQPPIQIKRVTSLNTPAHPSSVDAEAYRTQLDDRLAKVNFDDITVAELKEMLRERGLSATGRKAELMQRLKEEQDILLFRSRHSHSNSNSGGNVSGVIKAPGSPALHRRVANISLTDSPIATANNNSNDSSNNNNTTSTTTNNMTMSEKKRFSPYTSTPPQRHASISIAKLDRMEKEDRMSSSLPNAPSAYLNDQFMMRRKPSTLRNSLDQTDIIISESPPLLLAQLPPQPSNPSAFYYPTVEKIEETTDDVWDEQMLQNFLNQI